MTVDLRLIAAETPEPRRNGDGPARDKSGDESAGDAK